MLIVGAAAGAAVTSLDTWSVGLVVGWAAACLVYIAWVWLLIARMGPDETRSHAVREDPARAVAELLILTATVASLGAVALLLLEARSATDARAGSLAAIALASVALSWFMIHTLFTLR